MRGEIVATLVTACLAFAFVQRDADAQSYEASLNRIASGFLTKLEQEQQRSVTVLDFTSLDGSTIALGRLLATELSIKLVSSGGKVSVVDRQNLQYLLKERNLSTEGLIDPQTRRKLGNLIGVDAIIVGTIVPVDSEIRLSVRAISLETGRVLAADSSSFSSSPSLLELNKQDKPSAADSRIPSAGRPERTESQSEALKQDTRPARKQVLRPDLTIELASVSDQRSSSAGAIVASFSIYNTSNKPLLIGLYDVPMTWSCSDFRLTDGEGGFCTACARGGTLSSLQLVNLAFIGGPEGYFKPIGAMSSEQHVIVFHPSSCASQIRYMNNLSFGGTFMVLDGKQINRVPVSFTGVEGTARTR